MTLRLLIPILLATAAAAQQYPIIALSASGSDRYQPAEIVAYTGLKRDISKPVPLTRVQEAAQTLANSGVFSDIAFQHVAGAGGMKVTFTVKDKQADQFLPPRFENIVWFTPEALNAEIKKRVPLYHNDLPLKGTLIDEVSAAIKEALDDKGIRAHVSANQECVLGEEGCAFHYAIDNLQVTTRSIAVTGVSNEIAAEVQRNAKEILNRPYESSITDSAFTRLVRAACMKRGLLKPQISSVATKVLGQEGANVSVEIAADVAPGNAYKFEGQTWTGNTALPAPVLERYVHLYQHLPVDGAKLEQDLKSLQAELMRMGYMHARIKPHPEYDDAAGTVKYTFEVQEGALYKMGEFDLAGFPDKVADEARALWKLRQGEPFDRAYITQFFGNRMIRELFAGQSFVVEQGEGEQPNSIDVTVVLCAPGGCKPSPDVLYMSKD
jgi:outer membrane protein assembly factor BamA